MSRSDARFFDGPDRGDDPPRIRLDAQASGQGSIVQLGQGTQHIYLPPGGQTPRAVAAAVHTLPRGIATFTGRDSELDEILDAVPFAAEAGRPVAVHAIDGMAGVGKTAFALHAAHGLAPRFPDGQLFLDLHAHTPGRRPVDPGDALGSLLLAIGVNAAQIPRGLDARAALWRGQLAGRRMLVLLDDAAGHRQVRPLVPAASGCLVLITSRRRLAALDDVVVLSLDTLPPDAAAGLFARLAPTAPGESDAVARLVGLCGHLPLAIALLAGRLRHHRSWTIADLAADLEAARDRLAEIHAEDVTVAAAFDLSYQDLPTDWQRLFRRLGLHPGPDVDAYAAAALDNIDLSHARQGLDALYLDHLIDEPTRGRYRFHDLIRGYARGLTGHDTTTDRGAAHDRLDAYYLAAATVASRHVGGGAPASPPAEHHPGAVPDFASRKTACAWLETERANLDASIGNAAASGHHLHTIQLTDAMSTFLRGAGHWDQALALHHTSLTAARAAGDRRGEAGALRDLGAVQRLTDDYPAAQASLTDALRLYRGLGDRYGEADALTWLGAVQRLTDDHPAAQASFTNALRLSRTLGDRRREANALRGLGIAQWLTGDYPTARANLTDAVALYRTLGDAYGEANALRNLGVVQRATGDYPAAQASLTDALTRSRALGDRAGEAGALHNLGVVQQTTGDYPTAQASFTDALTRYRALGSRFGEANALRDLGAAQQATGDHPTAHANLTDALNLYRTLGNQLGEADVLNRQGELLLASATQPDALTHHEQALRKARELRNPLQEARALEGIGRCHLHAHNTEEGRGHLHQALAIYCRLEAPETEHVKTTLATLKPHDP